MAIFNSKLLVYQRVYPSFLPSISRYETTHLLFGAPLFCGDVDNVRRGGFGAIHMGMWPISLLHVSVTVSSLSLDTVTVSSLSLLNSCPLKQIVASSVCLVTATYFFVASPFLVSYIPVWLGWNPPWLLGNIPTLISSNPPFSWLAGWAGCFCRKLWCSCPSCWRKCLNMSGPEAGDVGWGSCWCYSGAWLFGFDSYIYIYTHVIWHHLPFGYLT